ncbi:MAG: riboflavin kinase [Bacteroides sp.]|nr:riboflavin kinase [Ruminococcus flavefaciens]MCM1555264.1 riboflavin kinase [Bacteroides sp.]
MKGLVFEGNVIQGDRLGRTIGFPTANLKIKDQAVVPAGVFACRATLPDGTVCRGMMNVGVRPTVNLGRELRVEVHLLDFVGDIYGQDLRVEIVEFIRGERKFDSLETLKAQLEQDRLSVRKLFESR